MAENVNALILPIGADVTQFQKSINDVKDRIKELSSTIKATPFNLVSQGQRDELAGLINTLEKLNTSVAATSAQFDKSVGSTKGARTALTSLSLVAQDAPFGFIAIQNNLPAVISSFGELSKGAGGLKGALSQVGSALVGPAGLFLAFSAVTGAVTFAIQKYGSLGAAFDALTLKSTEFSSAILKANKSLAEYNKNAQTANEIRSNSLGEVQKEIIKVEQLANVLKDSTTTDRQKKGALEELKRANDEYFGKLDAQKVNVDALNQSIAKYTDSLIKNQVAQNLASEAAAVFTQFLKQNQIAVDVANKINELKKAYPGVVSEAEKYIAAQERIVAQGGTGYAASQEVQRYLDLSRELANVNTNVKSTANSYGLLKTQADAAYKAASGFLKLEKEGKSGKGKIPGIGDIIEGTQGEGIITTNTALFERYIQAQVRLNNIGVDKMVRYRREQLNALDIMPDKLMKNVGTLGLSLPFGPEAQKNLEQYYNGLFEIDAIYRRFQDAQMSGANQFARLQEQVKQFNTIKDSIQSNLERPFRNFFDDLLENGKVSFDGFVELAKDAFKRIAAQAIASGLANLIAALLSGGGSLAIGKLKAAKKISSSLSFLGKTGGLFGSANFSGVTGGPLQMAGAVNLQLRGSDLVASINRTNSTINRIG